jgi:hypothetical protein
MPKYIIEREIPDAAAMSAADLRALARRSCGVLRGMGPGIQWVESFVTEDKITCLYVADAPELVREHARRGGFPADRVLEVMAVIDPVTAEGDGE